MDEVKKLTAELKTALEEKINSKDFSDFMLKMAETKIEDTGEFEMIVSTEHEDRSGEIVVQDGIDISHYMRNPIVLWAHNYSTVPVAVTDSLRKEMVNGVLSTIAKGRFAPTAFGQELRKMYENKFLNTASIGFMALEMTENKITKSQLLEWSFVPVPCNSFAERMKEVGIDIAMLTEKGFTFAKEGEPTKTEDIEEPKKDEEKVDEPKEDEKPKEEEAPKDETIVEENKTKADDGEDDDDSTTAELIGTEVNAMQSEIDSSVISHMKNVMAIVQASDDEDDAEAGKSKSKINTATVGVSLKLAIETIKTSLAALEVVAKAIEPEGSDETKESLKQRSRTAKVDKEVLDSFLLTQSIMRSVNQATSEGLAHIKTKLRDLY